MKCVYFDKKMPHRFIPNTVLSALVRELSIGVMIFEPILINEAIKDFRYVYVNALAARLYHKEAESMIGNSFLEQHPNLKYTDVLENYTEIMQSGQAKDFEQLITSEQDTQPIDRWYAFKGQRHEDFLVILIEDITNRKKLEQHIRQLVFQDELTGVHNRRFFVSRTPQLLSLAKRHGWSCGLLYFDLNGFKEVNDTYGHSMGDEVLKQIAWRLSNVSREQDIFFRSGGDEFALFLPDASEDSAFATARRIAEALTNPIIIEDKIFEVGASIGIAVMAAGDASLDALLERADSAMYKAKERKKDERVPMQLWSEVNSSSPLKTQF